jgi:hypothetical protein
VDSRVKTSIYLSIYPQHRDGQCLAQRVLVIFFFATRGLLLEERASRRLSTYLPTYIDTYKLGAAGEDKIDGWVSVTVPRRK